MKGPKTVYTCTECDYQSPKWLGKCPSCGAWNSFTEETYAEKRTAPGATAVAADKAEPFRDMAVPEYMRSSTGIEEFDRVLGDGLVVGVTEEGKSLVAESMELTEAYGEDCLAAVKSWTNLDRILGVSFDHRVLAIKSDGSLVAYGLTLPQNAK